GRRTPVHQGDHSGGDTTTRAAQVDRGGEPHAGLVLRSHQGRTSMQNAATSGYQRRTRTTTRKPARIGPLLTSTGRSGRRFESVRGLEEAAANQGFLYGARCLNRRR